MYLLIKLVEKCVEEGRTAQPRFVLVLVTLRKEKEVVEGELREAAGNLQERLEGCQSQLEASFYN